MFARRDNEPNYALLNDPKTKEVNQYGDKIDTVDGLDERRNHSLNINEDSSISNNPNRYKQHGFYFNADNCIGCHACEAACSEKNGNPAHLSFRSVGFVEGGTYPAYQRLNISMACNHCDDPVCLKGCPTRAYTKFAEYGAVLQDPDICFGCGYCTWVCPYNAPQLDPVEGVVSKCNMCVDRLEVGLKPACTTACLGNALDFGVIENMPENRTQTKVEIPGFPRSDITRPNIRFQQTRTTQRDMTRVDSEAIKYHRSEDSENFEPVLDPKRGFKKHWNLKKLLSSHENAHIAFTVAAQTVMGAFLWFFAGLLFDVAPSLQNKTSYLGSLVVLVLLISYGLFKLNMHLGKPHRFYRGFYNLKHSPVSREIAGVSLFYMGIIFYTVLAFINHPVAFQLQVIAGFVALFGLLIGGYFMYKLYRIEARPFWNHINTGTSFIATGLILGSLFVALMNSAYSTLDNATSNALLITVAIGSLIEMIGLALHAKDLKPAKSEGAASYYDQTTTYGYSYLLRNALLILTLVISVSFVIFGGINGVYLLILSAIALSAVIIGRALFYVLVIPTTMPGAFFWKNKGFEEHARETGLADMPQMGVAYERHHKFDTKELMHTIMNTSFKEKLGQMKRIFIG